MIVSVTLVFSTTECVASLEAMDAGWRHAMGASFRVVEVSEMNKHDVDEEWHTVTQPFNYYTPRVCDDVHV